MLASRPCLPIVHIHAPRFPCDRIEIIGNRAGIERLITVLIDSIGAGEAKDAIYTSDRRVSEVRVTSLRGERRLEEWKRSGSPYWDVDDPLIARIVDLTEENDRLRRGSTARNREFIAEVESAGGAGAIDDGASAER